MIAIEIESTFCAAHALRHGGETEALHGHNFRVVARVTCAKLDGAQTVADFHLVRELLEEALDPWQDQNLNLLEPFRGKVNPSAERLAEGIGHALQRLLGERLGEAVGGRGLRVAEVRVSEAPACMAIWTAGYDDARMTNQI
jgi:6-pyruvoyltetrahydropterin/6-carboxytetrahydropterin synthase